MGTIPVAVRLVQCLARLTCDVHVFVNPLKRRTGVCKACFSGDSMVRHGRAMTDYRDSFVADLNPESFTFPNTLGDLAQRLKAWRATLQATAEDTMPAFLRLEDESRSLQV